MSACAVTSSDTTTTSTKIPLMKWSQTRDTVYVVVDIHSPDTMYTPTVTFLPERVCVEATTAEACYRVDAELYGAILPDKSTWRVAANGQLLVTLAKRFVDDDEVQGEDVADTTEQVATRQPRGANEPAYRYCGWWDHPFHDRAYKGFVKIDWTRWIDEPDEYMEGDDDDSDNNDEPDFGQLSEASPFDFGGGEDGSFPSEKDNMFQEMLKTMGGGKDNKMPDMAEMAKDFDMSKMEDMMKSLGSGDMAGMEGLKDLDLGKMNNMLDSLNLDDEESGSSGDEDDDTQNSCVGSEKTTVSDQECGGSTV